MPHSKMFVLGHSTLPNGTLDTSWHLVGTPCTKLYTAKKAKSVLGLRPTTAILQESTRRRVSSHHRLAFRGRQPAVSNEPQFKLMVESEVETTFSAYLHKILSRPKHA